MMPEFEIFGLTFPSYWTMCAVGMLLIVAMSWLRSDVYGITFLKALILALCIDVFGVAGVMLLGFIQSGFREWNNSFMGAMLFTPLFVALAGLALKIKPGKATAFSAAPISVMGASMKIGCYLSGCCGGIVIGAYRVPVQLIESGVSLLIAAAMLVMERRPGRYRFVFPTYMVLYGATRLALEYLRDTEKNLLGMSMGQITALVVLIIGAAFIILFAVNGRIKKSASFGKERTA